MEDWACGRGFGGAFKEAGYCSGLDAGWKRGNSMMGGGPHKSYLEAGKSRQRL